VLLKEIHQRAAPFFICEKKKKKKKTTTKTTKTKTR